PWRQPEVPQEPRVQLQIGLNRTKGIPTSVPTTPQSSKSFMHCRSGKVRWKIQPKTLPLTVISRRTKHILLTAMDRKTQERGSAGRAVATEKSPAPSAGQSEVDRSVHRGEPQCNKA